MVGAVTVLLIISALEGSEGQNVSCSSEGVECDHHHESDLLTVVSHVYTLTECRQLCLDNADCQYISYFDDNAVPVSHLCYLFRACYSVNNCSSCTTESMECFESCSSNIVGDLDENILELIPGIQSEQECKERCSGNSECSFFTYFFEDDPVLYNQCFLLTEFLDPRQPCETCISGPRDCSNSCYLKYKGEYFQSLMLTNTTEQHYVTVAGVGSCKLNFLAVGGGGNYVGGTIGGGGSGL